MSCGCKCHQYGPGTNASCDLEHDTGSSGVIGLPSCSPCDGANEGTVAGRVPLTAADGRVQAPCVYPRCDDPYVVDGEIIHATALTFHTVCGPCRRRYGQLLDYVVQDYVTIKHGMQPPVRRPGDGSKHQSPKSKTFGHPGEWPSDQAALIAGKLNELEHDLRDYLDAGAAVHPGVDEVHRVKLAYDFLTAHFDHLCEHPAAQDYAADLVQLHSINRSRLGLTRYSEKLPTPCPSCDVAALVRSVGQIECGHCHRIIREDQYPFLARMVLDDLIDGYDRAQAQGASA